MVDRYAGKDKVKILFMGDEIDCIASSDKRYDSMAVAEPYRGKRNFIDLMIDDFCDLVAPLKGQVIAGVDSNHIKSYRKLSDSDPHYRISKHLGFERLGYGGWVCLLWDWKGQKGNRVRSTNIHITHGKPCGTTYSGTSINALERDAGYFLSDIMAHGHTHKLSAGHSRIFFDPDPRHGTYKKRKQHLVQTGSYLKSYSTGEDAEFSPYSEVKRYAPIDLGWAVAEISFDEYAEPRIQTSVREY